MRDSNLFFPVHQARGEVDFIRTKDGCNTAIPAAQGISNTKDIAVRTLTEKIDETYLIPLEEGTFEKARGFKAVYEKLLHLGRDYCVQKAGKNKDGSLYGTPFYPIGDGIVVDLRFNRYPAKDLEKWKRGDRVGNYITINHGNDIVAVYMHLAKVDVIKNQKVTVQTPLGEAGDIILHPNIPEKMCPHLHLEIRKNGVETLQVPPNLRYSYISQDGITKIEEGKQIENVLQWIDLNFYDPDSILVTRKASPASTMKILFVGKERVNSQFGHHLFAINSDGTGKYEIPLNYGFLPDITISPDKKKFALPYRGGIVIINIKGEKLKNLGLPEGMKFIVPADLRWSPDGTRIAFDDIGQANIRNSNIYVIYVENGNLLRLTQAKELMWDLFPTWTPDSKQIMFNRAIGSANKFKTYIIDADGTSQEKMLKDLFLPEFSRDGGRLAFVDLHAKVTVATYKGFNEDIEIKDVKQITNFAKGDSRVGRIRWFPDGTRIAFSDGYGEFFVVNVDGSNIQEIPVNTECRLIECVKDF